MTLLKCKASLSVDRQSFDSNLNADSVRVVREIGDSQEIIRERPTSQVSGVRRQTRVDLAERVRRHFNQDAGRRKWAANPGRQEAFMNVSVVIPVRDEAGNIEPLVVETVEALAGWSEYEIVVIDDGSRDGTFASLRDLQNQISTLRVLRIDRSSGQSAAVWTGVKAARGSVIATLDGDGQNDPADLPRMLSLLAAGAAGSGRRGVPSDSNADGGPVGLVIGPRTNRRDSLWRRVISQIANTIRGALLRDNTPDSGCGIKVFHREAFLELPRFDHMHRFLPALFRRAGYSVASAEVAHRPRTRGRSHYGTWDRMLAGIVDLAGMIWLIHRAKRPVATEFEADPIPVSFRRTEDATKTRPLTRSA